MQTKSTRYFRIAARLFVGVVFIAAFAYFGFLEYARYSMRALNCKTLSDADFGEAVTKALSENLYAPMPGKTVAPIYFKLDLGINEGDDTLVRIRSDAIDQRVYRGPYKKEFTIFADERLLGAGNGMGGDKFSIGIFQKSTRKVCSGVIESIRPWQANKTVHIKLLPFRELNELGLPETFEVRVR